MHWGRQFGELLLTGVLLTLTLMPGEFQDMLLELTSTSLAGVSLVVFALFATYTIIIPITIAAGIILVLALSLLYEHVRTKRLRAISPVVNHAQQLDEVPNYAIKWKSTPQGQRISSLSNNNNNNRVSRVTLDVEAGVPRILEVLQSLSPAHSHPQPHTHGSPHAHTHAGVGDSAAMDVEGEVPFTDLAVERVLELSATQHPAVPTMPPRGKSYNSPDSTGSTGAGAGGNSANGNARQQQQQQQHHVHAPPPPGPPDTDADNNNSNSNNSNSPKEANVKATGMNLVPRDNENRDEEEEREGEGGMYEEDVDNDRGGVEGEEEGEEEGGGGGEGLLYEQEDEGDDQRVVGR